MPCSSIHRLLAFAPLLFLVACVRPLSRPADDFPLSAETSEQAAPTAAIDTGAPLAAQMGTPVTPFVDVPTPDSPHYETGAAAEGALGTHVVAAGETLGLLAQRYGTTIEELISLNALQNPDLVQIGQTLQVPGGQIQQAGGPDFKIVPDSELVYGPSARDFDTAAFVAGAGGYLLRHQEEVEGQMMAGSAIVQLVADRYSLNPRLLLAVLEHQTGWVTQSTPASQAANLGHSVVEAPGLYRQLSWAADLLNLGYYGRAEGGLRSFNLGDDTQVYFSPLVNDGTAGVQRFFAAVDGVTRETWQTAVGADGLFATYSRLFGNPFAHSHEPILPPGLIAPALDLPWTAGETWYYTGGPHGAWDTGSAWGALDFVPPGDQVGCIPSDAWVTAMADGVVTRSGHGAVVVDLDGDGFAGTGWAITYMHLEARDRTPLGAEVRAGDRLGHPSCEGGFSNGTHVHVARSYNGRWINADGDLPFVMSDWVSSGAGAEYDGYLARGGITRGACVCREEVNAIDRP